MPNTQPRSTAPDLRLTPFLALSAELPWTTTGFDLDDDGDHYAFASFKRGDGQAELMLSTAPHGLTIFDARTWESLGGPFATGQDAAECARKALTSPRAGAEQAA